MSRSSSTVALLTTSPAAMSRSTSSRTSGGVFGAANLDDILSGERQETL